MRLRGKLLSVIRRMVKYFIVNVEVFEWFYVLEMCYIVRKWGIEVKYEVVRGLGWGKDIVFIIRRF